MKTYLKQAWQLLRQNKLFSTVYIVGTGLSITTVMVLTMVFYIKVAPVYPEVNRDRTVIIDRVMASMEDTGSGVSMGMGNVGTELIRNYLYYLKTPELVCAQIETSTFKLYPVDGSAAREIRMFRTDANYWKVFDFRFLHGRPYTAEEQKSGQKLAVVVQSVARRLYGDDEAIGKEIKVDTVTYNICGVVPDVSYATPVSYAEMWVPDAQLYAGEEGASMPNLFAALGGHTVFLVAPSVSQTDEVIAEVNAMVEKINTLSAASENPMKIAFPGDVQPYWKWELTNTFSKEKYSNNRVFDWAEVLKAMLPILLALLLVPAVNMAGMVSAMMDKRLAEFGVRKVFGGSRRALMTQILAENFLLTLIGGVCGLLLSYGLMYLGSNWVLTLFNQTGDTSPNAAVTFYTVDMLFNPFIFIVTLLLCFVLNYLSAIIPAYTTLRKPIIYSLNKK
ncbi:MAG: ABC transporter permease [Prevotellaceae bacterium]|jgi:hypothetical protein|nr:ABC transporter permease [Prevotellaceae bacterium]